MKRYSKMRGRLSTFLKRICLASLGAAFPVLLSGCYFFPNEEQVLAPPLVETPKITYTTVEVTNGNIEKKINISGSLTSSHLENLFFKFKGGTLKTINVKLGDKVNVGDLLAELDTDSLLSQIKQQEITVRLNEIRYESKKANPTTNSFDLEEAKLNLDSAKLRLDDLKNDYEKSRLYSSISGYVVYIDSVNPGDYVTANRSLITVADPNSLLIQYKGDETGNFQVGTKVDVKYKSKAFSAEAVTSPYVLPLDANKNLKNSVFFKVTDLPADAQIGESCDLTLILEKRENVIVIPRNMVNNYGGRNYVQILENGMKYERDVEVGLQTATEVEIKKGLKVGDKLIQR